MGLYLDQFDTQYDAPERNVASKTLIIASNPRSGSHYLGHALHHTGLFGSPFEYANPANLRQWKHQLGASGLTDAMAALMSRRTSSTGIFSIKIHWSHVAQFGGLKQMLACFPNPRIFNIRRRDMLGQAISTAIAQQTNVYISGQVGKDRAPVYNFSQIYRCLGVLLDRNAAWQRALATCKVPWDAMDFEDVRDLTRTFDRVAKLMELALPSDKIAIAERTQQQSGLINVNWRKRFLDDLDQPRYRLVRTLSDLKRFGRQAGEILQHK